jgi:hypothetical protein
MPALDVEMRTRLLAAWPEFIARLAAGDLVRDIMKDHDVSRAVLYGYLAANPTAKREWDMAREASADALYDEAMDNARGEVHKDLAQHVRTRIDTLKWAARIRNPRLYSDKSQVDVNVRTVDLTQIIRDAEARLAHSRQGQIINGTAYNCDSPDASHARELSPALPAVTLDPALLALL